MKKKYSLFSVIRWDTFPKAPSKLRIAFFFFFFFYEWEHRTGKMCPFSSLHPLEKRKRSVITQFYKISKKS